MKRFHRLASRLSVGRGFKEYRGHILASQEAIFVVVPSGISGVLNTLVTSSPIELAIGTFGKKIATAEGIIQVDISNLPEAISKDPSWPNTIKKANVFILPQTCVQSMRYPWWGSLEIKTAEERFNVLPMFLMRNRVLRNLRALGWEI